MIRAALGSAVAVLLALAACTDPATCALAPGETAVAVDRLGCPTDFAALATAKDDSVFAHTETVLVIIDREDGDALHFIDSTKYALHYQYASDHLNLAGKTAVGTLAEFNILNYRRPNRRFVLGKLVRYVDQDVLTYELAAGDTADVPMIIAAFERVRGAIYDGDLLRYRAVSAEQERHLPELRARIPTIATDEVFRGQVYQPLNPGTAYGVLRFRKTAALDGVPQHLVLLDRGDAVDPVVVGVTLVVRGDQAERIGVADLSQCQKAHVPIEQDVLARLLVDFANAQRLDHSDGLHRNDDLLELARGMQALRWFARRQNPIQC